MPQDSPPPIASVTSENIEEEHICCALGSQKSNTDANSKKLWLKERFQDGLTFKKIDVRGKAFIEYIPAEKAWAPIDASGFMHINCFWVSGQLKGKKFSNRLLDACIQDAKQKNFLGLTVISSTKKRPFLSDGSYLKYKGFMLADTATPFYELLYLPFSDQAAPPKFKLKAKKSIISETGVVLYYTNQCPFTEKSAMCLQQVAQRHHVPVTLHKFQTMEQARDASFPFTTYSLFYNGSFVTNELLSEKKCEAFIAKILSK